ncbi:MAG TPA: MgtC/SapB family protein [Candidatus Omnitrophota bacterium]|nr:MgtC/SapB family protein [Candidatus Omnitrophota bacterium]
MDITTIIFKVFLSVILSAFIGIEREIRQKVADLRTHILVGVGSTLIVLTSLFVFEAYKEVTIVDPTRMITGITTGIGFLCAGTIIRAGNHVSGLTSAATLWIVSGVGIAVGAGDYVSAITVSIVVFVVLIGMRSVERMLSEKFKDKDIL